VPGQKVVPSEVLSAPPFSRYVEDLGLRFLGLATHDLREHCDRHQLFVKKHPLNPRPSSYTKCFSSDLLGLHVGCYAWAGRS